ncbi:methyltransferase domain-containing protein [Streptomyces sp. CA-250714]|uniref:methyltransferase domain-containing protein n=1 Tax=Streptomyces sp. CA-250714 TaxID=3240060 RepID=UPI003D8F9007
MNWKTPAEALADHVTHRASRWAHPVATVPRHQFVPRWWDRGVDGWELHDGPTDPEAWQAAAYRDISLVTSVEGRHADRATTVDRPYGAPTSSATLPSLLVRMFQHAQIEDCDNVLDVGTGSGYGTALLARRLSPEQVTSVDVDAYLIKAARDRLASIGLEPALIEADATGPLPVEAGSIDRVVATVGVRPIPSAWLRALCLGGRLVTTLAGTSLIITAEKTADGGATGRVEWDRAGFMPTRHSSGGYSDDARALLNKAAVHDGDDVSRGPYPVVSVVDAWDLASMLELTVPGIAHEYREDGDQRTALMAHADGSWARATAIGSDRPTVHQGGPRRLWDALDECRTYWLNEGELPVRGARVFIRPDGATFLARGKWHVTLT